MTESRVDLLNWLNSTLELNYTKVEQLGSGAAYCQIMDSIYLDLPMTRVKFDASKEYEYLNNYKILQSCFVKHKINKSIPVEKLIKCKFQDNLEFFQWIRKYWKENKDESEYDPNSRRKFAPPSIAAGSGSGSTASSTVKPRRNISSASESRRSSGVGSSVLPKARTSRVSSQDSVTGQRSVSSTQAELIKYKNDLMKAEDELIEYKQAVEALETERNFYFNKLREIEILTESTTEFIKENENSSINLNEILSKIQEILYNTEEGFQVPNEIETEAETNPQLNQDINMEEETF